MNDMGAWRDEAVDPDHGHEAGYFAAQDDLSGEARTSERSSRPKLFTPAVLVILAAVAAWIGWGAVQ